MSTDIMANGHASTSTLTTEPREVHSTSSSTSGGYPSLNGVENGSNSSLYPNHNEDIVNHLYNSGFQNGNFADTILRVHQHTYCLHAIILSRSPFLSRLMAPPRPDTEGKWTIYVPLEHEPEVTQEGFAIALGYMYSAASLNLIQAENARGVLAAACLLGGMDDLCTIAYEACRQSISAATINQWLEFTGTTTPSSPTGSATPDISNSTQTSPYGYYSQRLRDDVFEFLVITLPRQLDVANSVSATSPVEAQPSSGRETLLQIFSRVPFDLFKSAIESPTFQIGSDQSRFKFAKEAIDMRKKAGIARGSGAEETVVLAFGGGTGSSGGSAVHVTRKLRKRPLWKVNA